MDDNVNKGFSIPANKIMCTVLARNNNTSFLVPLMLQEDTLGDYLGLPPKLTLFFSHT
jgi:hypothetical protein